MPKGPRNARWKWIVTLLFVTGFLELACIGQVGYLFSEGYSISGKLVGDSGDAVAADRLEIALETSEGLFASITAGEPFQTYPAPDNDGTFQAGFSTRAGHTSVFLPGELPEPTEEIPVVQRVVIRIYQGESHQEITVDVTPHMLGDDEDGRPTWIPLNLGTLTVPGMVERGEE